MNITKMILNIFEVLLFSYFFCNVETLDNKISETVRSYEDLLQLAKSSQNKPTKNYASYKKFLENQFQDVIKKVTNNNFSTNKYSLPSNSQNNSSNETKNGSSLVNENQKNHKKKHKKGKQRPDNFSTKHNSVHKTKSTKKPNFEKKTQRKPKLNPNNKLERRRKQKWHHKKKTEPPQNKTILEEIKPKQQMTKVNLTTPLNTTSNITNTNTSQESNDLRLAIMKFSQIKYKGPRIFQNESEPSTTESTAEEASSMTPTFLVVTVFIMVFSPSSILLICFKCYSRRKPAASKKQLLLRQLNAPSHSFFDTYLKHMEGSRSNRVISFGNLPSYREYKIKRALRGGQSETESDVSGREAEPALLEHSMHEEAAKLTPDRGILKGTKRSRGKDGACLVSFCEEDNQGEENEKNVHDKVENPDVKCTEEKNEDKEIVKKEEIVEKVVSQTQNEDDKTTTPTIHLPTSSANRNAKVQVVLPQQVSTNQHPTNEATNTFNK